MNEKSLFADIIVDITNESLDRTFQYRVPQQMWDRLQPGMQVLVPFGNGSRKIHGYVMGITQEPTFALERMKEIDSIVPQGNSMESRMMLLASWMREQYGSTMIQAIKTVLPVRERMKHKQERWLSLRLAGDEERAYREVCTRKHQTTRIRLLDALHTKGEVSYHEAVHELKVSAAIIKSMAEQEVVQITEQRVYRNPMMPGGGKSRRDCLTSEQMDVAEGIFSGWQAGDLRPTLIHGVTGSGKTLVYMELLDRVIRDGKQAILLIPEIALTYQTVLRFYQRFGDGISVLHSRLSAGERSDQFERARNGEIQIMIGPRSALFTPFRNLGLIIIDEEHESSYQSEVTPCYHAREAAQKRAELEGCPLLLGSATPSLEAYDRAQRKVYRLYELNERFGNRKLPSVVTVDMRKELQLGNRSILSGMLQKKIEECLSKKEQVMLFLNRRGYAGFISCRSCGTVIKCPHCDVSLAQHNHGKLICHYCGYEMRLPAQCPTCGSSYIGGFRAGTEQIEEIVKNRFANARVLRMDLDTTRRKDAHAQILSAFANQEADILIGTQMIVKGHDFPKVTLVGVLAADLSLNVSDYRASERTFQLLTQAVGRAGRGECCGEAVIQTYQPEHYCIQAAAAQDYRNFYEEEIAYRQLASYPPAANLFSIHASCMDDKLLEMGMDYIARFLKKTDTAQRLRIIGPADETIAKIADRYRKVIYVKQEDTRYLLYIKRQLERYIEINSGFKEIKIQFQMNA